MPNSCQPRKYNSVSPVTGNILWGWKCKVHGILTRKYSTEELRDQRMTDHIADPLLPS